MPHRVGRIHGGCHCIHWFVSNRRSSEPQCLQPKQQAKLWIPSLNWAAKHRHAASVCYRQGSASVNERSSRRRLPANDGETGMAWNNPDCHASRCSAMLQYATAAGLSSCHLCAWLSSSARSNISPTCSVNRSDTGVRVAVLVHTCGLLAHFPPQQQATETRESVLTLPYLSFVLRNRRTVA